ncbi:MAG: WbqC family protein [Flavobacteriales bacterium]
MDEFYYYDEVQYTKNDWRNRNQIMTPNGKMWLTIPVRHEYLGQPINEVKVAQSNWARKHWNTIVANYSRSPRFKELAPIFEEYYLSEHSVFLSEINQSFNNLILKILDVKTPVRKSVDYSLEGDRNSRIIDLCKKVEAQVYFSGKAAKNYIDMELFRANGIEVKWYEYSLPKEYPQNHKGAFDPYVSVIDYLFNS